MLSVVAEEDLEPARARGDELARVTRAPALGEADAHAVRVIRSVQQLRLRPLSEYSRAFVVEHLDGVAGHHLAHHQAAAPRYIQSRRVDEDGVLTAVVGPDPVRLFAEEQAVADLPARPLHGATALIQAQLAETEARALR